MNSLTNMAKHPALLISLLAAVAGVLACGTMPPGQARTRKFTIAGFALPVAMVYSNNPTVPTLVPGIATNVGAAQAFVSRVVRQAITDVLEQQSHSAGLSDGTIAIISGQLTVQISYAPLQCQQVTVNQDPTALFQRGIMTPHCIIVGNTVTALCNGKRAIDNCRIDEGMNIVTIPANHLTISGIPSTTNIFMGMASCCEQSGSNVGIGSIWRELRLSICDRQLKR